jgi:hypothetical protein
MNAVKIILVVVATCVLFLWPLPAHAILITIEIETVVDSVYDESDVFGGQINISDIITGTYIYDSDTLYTIFPEYGHWYIHTDSPYGMFLSAEGFLFETDPENVNFTIGVKDDCPGPFDTYFDEFRATSYNNLSLDGGISVSLIEWKLSDSSAQALSNMNLPLTAPFLSDWDFNRLSISGAGNIFNIESHVTSAILIPEPCTILLFGLGTLLVRKNKSML